MHAKRVHEALDFKRREDPHNALDVGADRASTYPRKYEDLDKKRQAQAFYNVTDWVDRTNFAIDQIQNDSYLFDIESKYNKFNPNPIIEWRPELVTIDTDNWTLDLNNGLRINDEEEFAIWLGLDDLNSDHNPDYDGSFEYDIFTIRYTFDEMDIRISDTLQDYDGVEHDMPRKIKEEAEWIFRKHINTVMYVIKEEITRYYNDEGVEEIINDFEWEFNQYGQIVTPDDEIIGEKLK